MTRSPRPRKPSALSPSMRQQLNSYALAASAAGVSLLALARASEAKVIYTETHQVTRARVPLYIDLNHDGINDFVLRTIYYAGTSGFEVGLNAAGYRNNAVAGKRFMDSSYFFSAASALPAGAEIGPDRKFPVRFPFMAEEFFKRNGGGQYSDLGLWVGKGQGVRNRYLGLKFVIHGKIHYGWARLTVTLGHQRQYDDVTGTLTGYAYETTPNKAIITGKTKGQDVITFQPDTLGALAQGKK